MSIDVLDRTTGEVLFRGRVVCVTRGSFVVLSPRGTWFYFAHDGRGLGGASDICARRSVL